MGTTGLFDLEGHFAFYGAYHSNPVFCWGGQFIGHGIFEKRAPALGDNFAQALLMGPYFVLLELLQSAFGYEPYPGFHKSVKAKIEANIKEWKVKNQKKLS
ncbi:hypothetical protein TB2_035264 [Malus domestica]